MTHCYEAQVVTLYLGSIECYVGLSEIAEATVSKILIFIQTHLSAFIQNRQSYLATIIQRFQHDGQSKQPKYSPHQIF